MNSAVKSLIPAIAAYVQDKGAYLSKTKLLKLLYLFDVEYYRSHRRTFTGFQWKFFHLGPWTNELDPLLDELEAADTIVAEPTSRPEFDSRNYKPSEAIDIDQLFPDVRDEVALKAVLNTWAERSTGEILDHVYFQTEPMEYAVRNAPLDFSSILPQSPERYKRTSSGIDSKEAARLRRQFLEKQTDLKKPEQQPFSFTPPRYDDEFMQALDQLDHASG